MTYKARYNASCLTHWLGQFDIDLRERNSEWGIRDLETVEAEGNKHGFVLKEVIEMPANNLFVWFRRDT
jgi:hypothetical protein